MKVIVAGLPKTGTKTMNTALRVLGCKTIYDYPENSYYLYKEWVKIFKEGPKLEQLRRMYDGVDAVVDAPCCYYWEELAEAFPAAKIILMERDEDRWYKSVVKQAEELNSSWVLWCIQSFTYLGITRISYRRGVFTPIAERPGWPMNRIEVRNKCTLKRLFRQHKLYINEKATKDRLLIYKVTDGWKPLCEFLNIDVPEIPFPHKNKGAEIFEEYRKSNEIIKASERQFLISMTFYVALAAFIVYKCLTWF